MLEKDWPFDKKKLIDSLSRAEGQVRGVKEKINKPHDPAKILQQLNAASKAIESVGKLVMLEYIKSEVSSSERAEAISKVENLAEIIKKYGV